MGDVEMLGGKLAGLVLGCFMFVDGVFQWQGRWAALAAIGLVLVLFMLEDALQDALVKAIAGAKS
jgi:hypothetical protein